MTYAPFGKKAGYKIVGVWKEIASGPKQERAERKKLLALAQARAVDLILVTELTRWGRSARFAARSLTCFKFRFVSSPLNGTPKNSSVPFWVYAPTTPLAEAKCYVEPPARSTTEPLTPFDFVPKASLTARARWEPNIAA